MSTAIANTTQAVINRYDALLEAARKREEKYFMLFYKAPGGSRRESAYLGLWRKWRNQLEVLEEARDQELRRVLN